MFYIIFNHVVCYTQYLNFVINNYCAYIDTLHLGSVQWFTFLAIDFPIKNTNNIHPQNHTVIQPFHAWFNPSNPTLGIPCSLRYVQASSKRPPPQPLLVRSHCTKSSGAKDRPCKSWKKRFAPPPCFLQTQNNYVGIIVKKSLEMALYVYYFKFLSGVVSTRSLLL